MSNHFVFGAIGFVLGGILGGILSGCWLGREYKKRIDGMQYEIDRLKTKKREEKDEELKTREEEAEKKAKSLNESLGYSFDTDDDIEFNDPFTEETGESEEDEEEKTIRLIDKKTYDEDLTYRDNETLTFYQQEGILADEFDEPVLNAADIIGMPAIEEAEKTNDDILYVDNEIEDKLYEIVVEKNESFYRDI